MPALLFLVLAAFAAFQAVQLWRGWRAGVGLALVVSAYVAGRPRWLVPPVLRQHSSAATRAKTPVIDGSELADASKLRHPALLAGSNPGPAGA